MNNIFLIILGMLLGIDKYYARFLPFEFLKGIPAISYLSLFYVIYRFKSINWLFPYSAEIVGLGLYGCFVTLMRYLINYSEMGFEYIPILRQSVSFALGYLSYIFFRDVFAKVSLKKLTFLFIQSSIPFLVLGCIQHFNGHQVGYFARVTSLFDEPSYYGDYLVLLLLPCFYFQTFELKTSNKRQKLILTSTLVMWIINFVAIQSGTAILKMATFAILVLIFGPFKIRHKLLYIFGSMVLSFCAIFIFKGYAQDSVVYGFKILANPDLFMKNHTFYDRFFPIYASIRHIFTLEGLAGFGFGGDYFEFYSLYPVNVQQAMLASKPTLSFFNSFAAKIILYMGIAGCCWILLQIARSLKQKDHFIKITMLATLCSTIGGLANFSLPYFWLWLALSPATLILFRKKDSL